MYEGTYSKIRTVGSINPYSLRKILWKTLGVLSILEMYTYLFMSRVSLNIFDNLFIRHRQRHIKFFKQPVNLAPKDN